MVGDSGRCSVDSGDVIGVVTLTSPDGGQHHPATEVRHHSPTSPDSGVTSPISTNGVINYDSDVIEDLELDEFAVLFNLEARRSSMTDDDVTTASMESLDQKSHHRCSVGPVGRKSSLPINIVVDRKDILIKKRAQSSPSTRDVILNQQNSSGRSILTKMRELSKNAYHDSTLIFGEKPGRTTNNKFHPT